MDKLVVTELIQNDLNISMLQSTLTSMLKDEQEYLRIKSDYKELWHLLGNQQASLKAAQSVVALAQTAHK
jgi:lipid A disaccharide synthetase